MTVFAYDLMQKHQVKMNDCWFASIQMLKTQAAGFVITVPTGEHTAHLHSGIMGHRLNADALNSKHFLHVVAENGLKILPMSECDLDRPEQVLTALQKYGAIMVGGKFGEFLWKKHVFGHFIVIAGVDTDKRLYKINDPMKYESVWVSASEISTYAYNDDPFMLVVKPA